MWIYLPFNTLGSRILKRLMNSSKVFRVGYPAQLILIASITPWKQISSNFTVLTNAKNPIGDKTLWWWWIGDDGDDEEMTVIG